jgi:ADP-ribose 1''-phosphate phosphatase
VAEGTCEQQPHHCSLIALFLVCDARCFELTLIVMAVKHASPGESERPLKQSKLDFGGKKATASKATSSKTKEDEVAASVDAAEARVPTDEDTPSKTLTSEADVTNGKAFTVTEIVGDIFDAPDNTVIIHACNCLGSWSAGIALAFKQRYPKAFQVYKEHCESHSLTSLIGTALLIPPTETKGPCHYVGCLFTSKKYGRGRDSPAQILKSTGPAMEDLVDAIVVEGGKVEEVRMCQINSGLFSVPWAKSREIIEGLDIGDAESVPREIKVYSLPEAGKGRK